MVVTTPSGAFVYTGNANNSISEYTAKSGALTLVSGSPIKGFGTVNGLVVDSRGTYVYVLDATNKVLDSYSISAKTGALTFFSSATIPANAQSLALDPTGVLAVVTTSTRVNVYFLNNGNISGFEESGSVSSTTGATVDQSSQYILAVEPSSNKVVTFTLNNSGQALTQLASAATGNHPSAVLAEPSGKYVYVANSADGTISPYSLSNSTGKLTSLGSAVAAGAGTQSLAVSNDGKWLYAANETAGTVSSFKIGTTGALSLASTATTGTSPTAIVTTGSNQ